MKFVDEVSIKVSSGKGGPGCVSFRRESKVPRGGPDGGDGGRGGHVIVRTNPQLGSLLDLRYRRHYKAGTGQQGGASQSTGPNGKDLIIEVPPGTMIKDAEGNLIEDLGVEKEYTLLQGGRGGKGNTFFKTSINQAPTHAQPGEPGETRDIVLELKLLADVGIIGFPNVGKSTLISHISAAKPKVADYPFTTLVPNLGVVRYGDERTYVVADIPGLVPDAHKGVGLGTQFLRHIERTKVFIHVVDASEVSQRDPLEDFEAINIELEKYDELNYAKEGYEPLIGRKQIVVLNKVDAVDQERLQELSSRFKEKNIDVWHISAATGQNLKELVFAAGKILFEAGEDRYGE